MKESKIITDLPNWHATAESHRDTACIVKDWELVNIELDEGVSQFINATVVSDYKGRWDTGGYVFTSPIIELCLETGLVNTGNSVYCLTGVGLEVFPTLEEAYTMRMTGQSLSVIREIEAEGLRITGVSRDD